MQDLEDFTFKVCGVTKCFLATQDKIEKETHCNGYVPLNEQDAFVVT